MRVRRPNVRSKAANMDQSDSEKPVGRAMVSVATGEVAIKAEAHNGSFHVSVRDTGPGIPAADQAKLFQEFQQADNAITRNKGGTGLGLASLRCREAGFGSSRSLGKTRHSLSPFR